MLCKSDKPSIIIIIIYRIPVLYDMICFISIMLHTVYIFLLHSPYHLVIKVHAVVQIGAGGVVKE